MKNCNGHEKRNPIATLIEVSDNTDIDRLKQAEKKQLGVGRMGGSWFQIMKDIGIQYQILSEGKNEDMKIHARNTYIIYKLISGNY